MLAIGLTGSYASGKTFILERLAKKGYSTFSADRCIKELYVNKEIQNEILNLLPNLEIFDLVKIGNLIYNDRLARQKLQSFVYPLLIDQLLKFKIRNNCTKFIFAEIPLLYESDFQKYFDFIVTVFCSEEVRVKRAMSRKNFNYDIYKKIEKIQLSQEQKIKKANFAIDSDGDIVSLEKQIIQLIKELECQI